MSRERIRQEMREVLEEATVKELREIIIVLAHSLRSKRGASDIAAVLRKLGRDVGR